MKKWQREVAVGAAATVVGGLVVLGIRAATKKAPSGGTAPRSGPPGTTPTCPSGQVWDSGQGKCVPAIVQTKPCPGGQSWDPVAGVCVSTVVRTPPGGPPPIPPAAVKTWVPVQTLMAGDRARVSVNSGALLQFLQNGTLLNWFANNSYYFHPASVRSSAYKPTITYNPGDPLPADWPSGDASATGGYHIEYSVGATAVPANFPPTGAWRAWKLV
jgi:hypothetical protein